MVIEYLIKWGICSAGLFAYNLTMMSHDNLWWISAGGEYELYKKMPTWKKKEGYWLEIEGKKYYTKIHYIFGYRIKTVLTHWRDRNPSLIHGVLGGALLAYLI